MLGQLTFVAVVLTGCGRVGFDAVASRDGSTESTVDAKTFLDASSVCGAVPFNDGFDDGVPGPAWTIVNDPGVTVGEVNGALQIALPPTATSYGRYNSTCTSDLSERSVSVEVTGVVGSAPGVQMYLMLAVDGPNNLGIQYELGTVRAFWRVGDVYTDLDVLTYDPVAHRHWRVAIAGGQIRWDVSPDGIEWTMRATQPVPFDLSVMGIALTAGLFQNAASPGTASFASFAVR
jgi:hypothetical protein